MCEWVCVNVWLVGWKEWECVSVCVCVRISVKDVWVSLKKEYVEMLVSVLMGVIRWKNMRVGVCVGGCEGKCGCESDYMKERE